jgi:hypothetical protein
MPPAERSLASVSGVEPAPWVESIGSPAVAFVSAAFNVEDAAERATVQSRERGWVRCAGMG